MGGLAIVEHPKSCQEKGFFSTETTGKKEHQSFFSTNLKIAEYLDINLVFFLNAKSSKEAIEQMIEGLEGFDVVPNKNAFKKAVFEREKIVSTGIGIGVAVPHAKLSSFRNFFISVGIQKGRGIEWNSIDRSPVRLIFMIGGPDNRQTEYLQILSSLTRIIKDEELRKKIISSRKREEVIKLLVPF